MSAQGHQIFGNPNSYFNYLNQSFGKEDKNWLNNSFGDRSWLNNSLCLPPEQRYQALNEMVAKIVDVDDETQKSLMASGNSIALSNSFGHNKNSNINQIMYFQAPLMDNPNQQSISFSSNFDLNNSPVDYIPSFPSICSNNFSMPIFYPPNYSHQLASLTADQQAFIYQQQSALMTTLAFQEMNLGYQYSNHLNNQFQFHFTNFGPNSIENDSYAVNNNQKNFKSHRKTGPSNELHIRLEECLDQLKSIENERKKIENEISFLKSKKNFNQINSFRLNPKPSRVDRLIYDSFKEHSRVYNLIVGSDGLKRTIFYDSIFEVISNWFECIKVVQEKRKSELNQLLERNNGKNSSNENEIMSLANSIKDLSLVTKKSRTSLWCAFNILNLYSSLHTDESLLDTKAKVQDFVQKTFEIKTDLIY